MKVRFSKRLGMVSGRPVDDADNRRILNLVASRAWTAEGGVEPYHQHNDDAFLADYERLGLVWPFFFDDLFADGPVEVDVSEEEFLSICRGERK